MVVLFDDTIDISDGQIGLEMLNAADWDDWDARFYGQSNGMLGVQTRGIATFLTGLQGGYTHVRVEMLDAEPPLDPEWEDVVEASFTPTDTKGQFSALYVEPFLDITVSLEPHRIRYSAKGMDAADEEMEVEGEPIDSYLIEMWPAPVAPDVVVKQTSEKAAYWHTAWKERAAAEGGSRTSDPGFDEATLRGLGLLRDTGDDHEVYVGAGHGDDDMAPGFGGYEDADPGLPQMVLSFGPPEVVDPPGEDDLAAIYGPLAQKFDDLRDHIAAILQARDQLLEGEEDGLKRLEMLRAWKALVRSALEVDE